MTDPRWRVNHPTLEDEHLKFELLSHALGLATLMCVTGEALEVMVLDLQRERDYLCSRRTQCGGVLVRRLDVVRKSAQVATTSARSVAARGNTRRRKKT